MKQAPAGTYEAVSSADGVRRRSSYEQGHTYPLVVAVGQDVSCWRPGNKASFAAGEIVAITALIILMGAFVWRATSSLAGPIRSKLRETNAQLRRRARQHADRPQHVRRRRQAAGLEREVSRAVRNCRRRPHQARRQHQHDRRAIAKRSATCRLEVESLCRRIPAGACSIAARSTIINRLNDGRIISVANTAIAGGGWVAIHEDITERIRDEEALFKQATELARTNLRFDAALEPHDAGTVPCSTSKSGSSSGTSATPNCTRCRRTC